MMSNIDCYSLGFLKAGERDVKKTFLGYAFMYAQTCNTRNVK